MWGYRGFYLRCKSFFAVQASATHSWGWVRYLAKLISYLLHPLFMPLIFFGWLTLRFGWQFPDMSADMWVRRWLVVGVNTLLFPGIIVLLMWRLGFVQNIFLRTQKERIIPYISTMFFYWWIYYLSRNFTDQPEALKAFYLGSFICISAALICNSFFKISMHALGMGGLAAAMVLTSASYATYLGADLLVVLLLAGLTGSARLALGHHHSAEIYMGYFVAIASQCAGFWWVLG